MTLAHAMKYLKTLIHDIWAARNGLPFRPFLRRLAYRAYHSPRHRPGRISIADYEVEYIDLLSFYIEYKDIFVQRIYHFQTHKAAPLIIDGGGCIGLSVLFFKTMYPKARVIAFEPDPQVFSVLQRNIRKNVADDSITLIQAGLAGESGTMTFLSDGVDGGRVVSNPAENTTVIQTVKLSDYLTEPVDFLKLNIEGQEWDVLQELEASGKLHLIQEMVIEYHGWPRARQTLGAILELLDRHQFRYLVHDFDAETGPASKPPFSVRSDLAWYCLIYAVRVESKC